MNDHNTVEENIRYIAQGHSRWDKTYNGYYSMGSSSTQVDMDNINQQ